jgi:AraC-like DNA-binding protein
MLISTLPVIALGLLSFKLSSATLLKNTTESSLQVLEQTESGIEHNLKIVDETLNHFSALPEITSATLIPLTSLNFQAVADVSTSMDYIHTSELGINRLYFFNVTNGWFISPERVSPLSEEEIGTVRGLITDHSKFNWFENGSNTSSLSKQLGFPSGIFLVRHIPQNLTEPRGAIIASISFEQLQKWISTEQRLGSIYIFNKEYQLLVGSSSDWPEQKLADWDVVRDAQASPQVSGYEKGLLDNRTVHLFYYKSGYTGWTYVSLVSDQAIRSGIHTIGWLTALISVSIILLSILLSMTGSFRFYRPLRKLMNKFRTDPLQEGDEFDLINQSFSNMEQQMVYQESQLQLYLVLKLFHGELTLSEIPGKIEAQFPNLKSFSRFAVFTFQIDTLEGTRYTENDRDLLLFALKNIVEELIARQDRLPAVVMHHSLVCFHGITAAPQETDKRGRLQIAQMVQKQVETYLSVPVSVGISRIIEYVNQAPSAYLEGVEALKYRIRFGNQAVLFFEDLKPDQARKTFLYPAAAAERLIDAIRLDDKEDALVLLRSFISRLFEKQGNLIEYQMAMIRLLSDILQLHDASLNNLVLEFNGRSLPSELMELQTPSEIEQWFQERVIEPILELLKKQTAVQYKTISSQIVQIVEQDFDKNLTLEAIGLKLNYSPAYLSQIFRKDKGIPFTEFLTQQRMKLAKQWLSQTEMTVNEIAEKLGYQNTQNFIRFFKKDVGVTPGHFRRNRIGTS